MAMTVAFFLCNLLGLAIATSSLSNHAALLLRQAPSSSYHTCDGSYFVDGMTGGFSSRTMADFSQRKAGDSTDVYLGKIGVEVSNYPVESGVVPREFSRQNVAFVDGALQLRVNAFTGGRVSGAEILTRDLFRYASVRTVFRSSRTPGVVQSSFFYANDTQEVDWEILTSTITSSSSCVPAGIWATNQAHEAGGRSTHQIVTPPFHPADDFHEYRMDWSPNETAFYLDGQLQARLTYNVPSVEGRWIWNTWSSGDPCWSAGPPQEDALMQIRSIEIFRGYDETLSSVGCGDSSLSRSMITSPTSVNSADGSVTTVFVYANGTKAQLNPGTQQSSAKPSFHSRFINPMIVGMLIATTSAALV